jgi:hypothetical protein
MVNIAGTQPSSSSLENTQAGKQAQRRMALERTRHTLCVTQRGVPGEGPKNQNLLNRFTAYKKTLFHPQCGGTGGLPVCVCVIYHLKCDFTGVCHTRKRAMQQLHHDHPHAAFAIVTDVSGGLNSWPTYSATQRSTTLFDEAMKLPSAGRY